MQAGRCFATALVLSSCCAAWSATRFEQLTKRYEKLPDRAEVIAATYLGGSGTEWLAAGGVQPDGTIVVAGVCLGPELDLGQAAAVLGTDLPLHAPVRQVRRDRAPRPETLAWNHPNATAFVARLSPDLKAIRSVTRLGWRNGGLTAAAIDRDGHIYIAGPSTNAVADIAPDSKVLSASGGPGAGGCAQTYLAKLSPDASRALWVRVINGPGLAPKLRVRPDGRIQFQAQDLRLFDSAGELISTTPLPVPTARHVAVSPHDSSIAIGGEHHWPTGREPYRDPVLNIYKPDGTWLYELYNWDGPFVGLNSLRLVSDSAIRGVAYDDAGHLVIHAWSDGGNSVMSREPNNVYAVSKKMGAMGFSAWGAGVLSCAYLIKIETNNYTVAAGTLWLAYLHDREKPNSVTVNTLGFAQDGSVCLAGNSAWGLIQTGNAFSRTPSGPYVAIMNQDLTSLRFSSVVPGTGQTEVADDSRYGIATGLLNGKPVALFLSGADAKDGQGTAPLLNARQENFGGGSSDGHLLLLDLSVPAR